MVFIHLIKMQVMGPLIIYGSCILFYLHILKFLKFSIGLDVLEMASFLPVWIVVFHLMTFLIIASNNVLSFTNADFGIKYCLPTTSEILVDVLFHAAGALSVLNLFLFWLAYCIDLEMIMPETVDFHLYHLHMLHTLPLVIILMAFSIHDRIFTKSGKETKLHIVLSTARKMTVTVCALYMVVIWVVFENEGVWPYPFMFSFNRGDFLILSLCLLILSYVSSKIFHFIYVNIQVLR